MKLYQSHKRVQAARITEFLAPTEDGGVLVKREDGVAEELTREMTARYRPSIGDYIVVYEDGYRSISPKKAFEDGYTLVGEA